MLTNLSSLVTVIPAVDTSAYSSGDCIGGKLTLSAAVRGSGAPALLQSLCIIDKSNQKAPLDILILDALPAGTYTDQAAFPSMSSADASHILRRVTVAAADYVTVGGVAIAEIGAIGKIVKPTSGTGLFALIATTGTPTYAALALILKFGFLQD